MVVWFILQLFILFFRESLFYHKLNWWKKYFLEHFLKFIDFSFFSSVICIDFESTQENNIRWRKDKIMKWISWRSTTSDATWLFLRSFFCFIRLILFKDERKLQIDFFSSYTKFKLSISVAKIVNCFIILSTIC